MDPHQIKRSGREKSGSIEHRIPRPSEKASMNNTTRNFSSIISQGGNMHSSIIGTSVKNQQNLITNSIGNGASIKLTPINKSK